MGAVIRVIWSWSASVAMSPLLRQWWESARSGWLDCIGLRWIQGYCWRNVACRFRLRSRVVIKGTQTLDAAFDRRTQCVFSMLPSVVSCYIEKRKACLPFRTTFLIIVLRGKGWRVVKALSQKFYMVGSHCPPLQGLLRSKKKPAHTSSSYHGTKDTFYRENPMYLADKHDCTSYHSFF